MRTGRGGFAVAWFLAVALIWHTPSASGGQDQAVALGERLAQSIPARMAADGVPGAVVVLLAKGVPVWSKAFGMADPATGRVMSADARFRVESISKPVTAWGALRLQETGRLELDTPITSCLTRWQPPTGTPAITPRQLLSHSAGIGLGDYAARYAPDAARPDLAAHLAADFRMIAAPGAGFAYSDTGYNLLELVIEDCAGEEFGEFMAREVLAPLGMERSGYGWQAGLVMPVGHDLRGRAVSPYVYPGRGSGGLHATAADVARFARAQLPGVDQAVLSYASLAEMRRPVVAVDGLFGWAADGYGLGYFTETLSDGRTAVWHGGQGYGWMSHLHLVPTSGDGIVILANSQRAWPLFASILHDWSALLDVSPVGMTRVLWAGTAARIVIAVCLGGAVLALLIAIRGRRRSPAWRSIAGGLAAMLLLWPVWAAFQDYLFLFSLLPRLWPWLGVSSGLAGLGLIVAALAPARRRRALGVSPSQ